MILRESTLEEEAVGWFAELGYDTLDTFAVGPLAEPPLRTSIQETLLAPQLRAALLRLNPEVPESVLAEALHRLLHDGTPGLLQANHRWHGWLRDGLVVDVGHGDAARSHRVRLVDFERPAANVFSVIRQFVVGGADKRTVRLDLVVCLNGLPIALLELKNPADSGADVWQAVQQLQTYQERVPDLFRANLFLIASDGVTARLGGLGTPRERFQTWRTVEDSKYPPPGMLELEVLIRGVFPPAALLDYLRYFVLWEDDGVRLVKKLAAYHQFYAVRAAVKRTLHAFEHNDTKLGVVWHTTGSGKSISMCCYAAKIVDALRNPTLVVVTDRRDLDDQLFSQFQRAKDLLRQEPERADDREELRAKLAGRAIGGILFTTIQKFTLLPGETEHPPLNRRANVIVISDEAHRSQYGLEASLNLQSGKMEYGYAKHLRDALPAASFIGFTGTPISASDKDTRRIFGDYIDIYDLRQAVRDGATVPIYYESRTAKLQLDAGQLPQIDAAVEDVAEGEEESVREKLKTRWAAVEKLAGAKARLAQIAKDLVWHFEQRTATLPGKGMIVAMSREICVDLFDAIIALRPDWAGDDPAQGAIKIMMTGSASDPAKLRRHIPGPDERRLIERRFKDPADPLRLVIVRDMWLTGFDVPCLHTLYVDKPMQGHSLMQAIARVNRVFEGKPGGLVVDYIGLGQELKEALHEFTRNDDAADKVADISDAWKVLLEKVEIARGLFNGFDYRAYATAPLKLLKPAADHVLGLPDGKKRLADVVAALKRSFNLCGTHEPALKLREEIAFFAAVRAYLVKASNVELTLRREDRDAALRRILDGALMADQVVDVFEAAGLEKPNLSILDDQFLADLQGMEQSNLAVEMLQKLLEDEIKSRATSSLVQSRKFSELLRLALSRYEKRTITTAQLMEELLAMARSYRAAIQKGEALGLTREESAFYDALADNEAAARELSDDILRTIARELLEQIRRNAGVDWQKRDSVRAQLRLMVKRILRKHRYPPEADGGYDKAIQLVLDQAETFADEWSK